MLKTLIPNPSPLVKITPGEGKNRFVQQRLNGRGEVNLFLPSPVAFFANRRRVGDEGKEIYFGAGALVAATAAGTFDLTGGAA